MSIGIVVRRAVGPLEPKLANLYRSVFFDVEDFAARVSELEHVRDVLEIGCGEGAVLTALSGRMPQARFVGIDTSPAAGRLYAGDAQRVLFRTQTAQSLASTHRGSFDVVLIGDVLHHVATQLQPDIIRAAVSMLRPTGRLVIKEWIRTPTPIFWLGFLSDRFITGDRIHYLTREQWIADAIRCARGLQLEREWSLKPWASNHAMVFNLRRSK
jgi:2-polyprenyl-6-hydroxyphenyl methylase/3-demethylubiquinone-9 3-methyltransferase